MLAGCVAGEPAPGISLLPGGPGISARALDPTEPTGHLLRDLRTDGGGLSSREAARRMEVAGPNELPHRPAEPWWRELVR